MFLLISFDLPAGDCGIDKNKSTWAQHTISIPWRDEIIIHVANVGLDQFGFDMLKVGTTVIGK